MTMVGAKDQFVWTVGDNYNCDIIIPKASIGFGHSFIITAHDGKHYFKDCSDIDLESSFQIKLGHCKADEEANYVVNEIQPNDIISFFNNTLYVIKNASNKEVEMSLVKEIAIETGDQYLPPEAEVKKPIPDGGLIVSKLKSKVKVTIKHPNCSGTHARFVENGIIDHSTNGTFLLTKYRNGLAHL